MTDTFSLTFPAKAQYALPIRLFVSGIASRMNYSLEELENIKTAVSEGCTILMLANVSEDISMRVMAGDDQLDVELAAAKNAPGEESGKEEDILLSKTILEAFADSVCICENDGPDFVIQMTFKRTSR